MTEQRLEGQGLAVVDLEKRNKFGLVSGLTARAAVLFPAVAYVACGGISEEGDSQTPTPFGTMVIGYLSTPLC